MHFVSAIDSVGGLRPVLGLHETVCSGAAGGWQHVAVRRGRQQAAEAAVRLQLQLQRPPPTHPPPRLPPVST
jgi:hypothetical protein